MSLSVCLYHWMCVCESVCLYHWMCVCESVCLLGCELKGRVISGLEPDGRFMLMLTDEMRSDDVYNNVQHALKSVLTRCLLTY